MDLIKIEKVTKFYNKTKKVINDLSFSISEGEFIVVLGPSGCGKSTLLRMIAGLEDISGGVIIIDDIEVQNKEPKERGCAMVFQNYALYPHMTVEENIGYSLKLLKLDKRIIRENVKSVANAMGLGELMERLPHQLSGGQRQRVAIGRAIVREPKVLLFDEPLSNLDARLRNDMRIELMELHKRIKSTSIFVTHDQVEAMTLADRILILNNGSIAQFGTPAEIYSKPNDTFVASFIGSPSMNIVPLERSDGGYHINNYFISSANGKNISSEISLGIRPEDVSICNAGDGISFLIEYREELGSHTVLHGRLYGDVRFRVTAPFGMKIESELIYVNIPGDKCHFFNAATGKKI
jgi:sn-glycerol 3-phosphate transport system ATP-binding protein